jgi:thymidylate kinase
VQNLPDIKNQLSTKELFDAFKTQLAKDFEQSNFPFDFVTTLEPNYNSIHEKIANELQRNEKKIGFTIMPLLYRVDISEAQLKKYLTEHSSENHFHVIAELIIKRVLQKVVTKHYYKANQNP